MTKSIPTDYGRRLHVKRALVAMALVAGGCGYSEMEMQAQRDKAAQMQLALDRVATDLKACAQVCADMEPKR